MDDKSGLAFQQPVPGRPRWQRRRPRRTARRTAAAGLLLSACLCFIAYAQWRQLQCSPPSVPPADPGITVHGFSVKRLQDDLATCSALRKKPQDPIGAGRKRNSRYIDGHAPTLIKNATVWIGEPPEGTPLEAARNGTGYGWIHSDVYLEYGLIQRVEAAISLSSVAADTIVFDARGRPLTAGIIDMHSHAGVGSLPSLWGNEDTNEMSANISPFVRSIDALHPLDPQIQVIKSGGVTTSLVLPGSGNNMGGEAYVIKHAVGKADGRNEISAADLLADPDRNWRYMKMACGENAKRVYGRPGEAGPMSRMGESWDFRHAFEQATKLVREQDDWCDAAVAHGVHNVKSYLPQELRWESLGALLRGQVHLNTHCYTISDLEAFIDHTNEFKFKLRAFHHAHQTFLVPEILKRAYGGDPPASALFADNMYYKAEANVASEFAGKILWDNGLTPIYVSDNPVLNAQHVLFEAAKAYKYGLPYHAALASVTTAPAERLGFGQRLGKIKPGYDADVVVWDSDPLSVGAAPVQVWIDGTVQFKDPVELDKPVVDFIVPNEDLTYIPGGPRIQADEVVFTGVTHVLLDKTQTDRKLNGQAITAVFSKGKFTCLGDCEAERQAAVKANIPVIHLKNGYLTESFTAFGSKIGLNAIDAEDDTDNGPNPTTFVRAEDGLVFDNQKLNASYTYGVTKAITAPSFRGGFSHHGTSVGFLTGAKTAVGHRTVFAGDASVHYTFDTSAKQDGTPSISAAVGTLRRKLLEAHASLSSNETIKDVYSETAFLQKVVNGSLALVITVHSADTIGALLKVKEAVEEVTKASIRLVILGGAESWLVAEELAAAKVGVVLAPLQSYAVSWDQRRALTGAPLTNGTAVDRLLESGVVTAIGLEEDWLVRDLGLLAGIVYRNGGGKVDEKGALDLVSGNVYKLLGLKQPGSKEGHFVISEGSPLDIGSRVKAIGGGTEQVTLFAK
ncbi:hypothetical protein QBC36DRAFT_293504 [Triangularia setosa]|uniref:Amidohydrolase 3 domain-containing protein n=1 Tax=Triangularia setosa TaxID=2587417 RepID=A0AAN6W1S6_9PEZI|nr:hypothetical protein QBC36DRAFT_293504 [Podospora setosa]